MDIVLTTPGDHVEYWNLGNYLVLADVDVFIRRVDAGKGRPKA